VALLVWGSMVGFLLAFLAMELTLHLHAPVESPPRALLFGLAAVTSALGIALSRLLPPRIPARQAGGRPAALALLRMVIGWALCEGPALFALVAHLLTHDARLLGIFAVDLLALVTLYPGPAAWERLSAERPPPGRMVR
jgi:F0F1-type ATP synthase membrane subunit c/vacuolar-type H+-ATPase subunit K